MEKKFLTIASALTFASLLSFNAYADMDLETYNAVSGMAVALNNYKASSVLPKTALEDSLKSATTKTIEIQGTDDARTKLINDVIKYEPPSIQDKLKGDIAVASGNKEVSVLSSADENGQEVGSITYSSVATVLETVVNESGEWYKINSGNVDGYVKSSELTTGEEAKRLADESSLTLATVVDISSVRLRTSPEVTSETLTMLEEGEEYVVLGHENNFVKVQVDDDLVGYVYKDFVTTDISYKTAKTNEESTVEALERDKVEKEAEDAMSFYENLIIAENDNAADVIKDAYSIEEDSTTVGAGTPPTADSSTTGDAQIVNGPSADKETTYETVTDIKPSKSVESKAESLQTSEAGNTKEELRGPGVSTEKKETTRGDTVPETPSGETVKSPETERVYVEESTRKVVSDTKPDKPLTKPSESVLEKETTQATTRETKPAGSGVGTQKATEAQKTTEAQKSTTSDNSIVTGVNGGPGVSKSKPKKETAGTTVEKASRTAIAAYAKQFVGNPYVYGGTSLTSGADCSGFTMRVYEHFGITTGRTTRQQAKNGREISLNSVEVGDLIFYANSGEIGHVGIYIGNDQIVHAANSKRGIIISSKNYRTPVKAVTFLK